jgi:hypothetical protein
MLFDGRAPIDKSPLSARECVDVRLEEGTTPESRRVMTTVRTRRHLTLVSLVVPAFLAACGTKEQASPPATTQAGPPSAAPITTTTTTTTTVPSPPSVWRAARWGMTKGQVLAAFPREAQRLAQPANFGPPSGGSTDVAIPAYEINGMTFRVLFGFEPDVLNRVHLSAVKAGATTCSDLEKLLTEKYSAPSDRSNTQTNLRSEQIFWKQSEQTITLACTEAPDLGYRSVTLDYTVPSKD